MVLPRINGTERRVILKLGRVVVLGCGGFIGSHLLEALLERGYEVEGWDLEAGKIGHLLDHRSFRFHPRSIQAPETLDELRAALEHAGAVVNLAAICLPARYSREPLAVIRSNFLDHYPIVDLCAEEKRRLIHFSTSEVYGRTLASHVGDTGYGDPDLYELDEDLTPLVMGPVAKQRWSYAAAKQLLERYIQAHGSESGLSFTIVRPLNAFGPRMDFVPGHDGSGQPRVLASFMGSLLDGRPLRVVDGGHARRTIVSVHDLVEASVRILERPTPAHQQIFNIGNRGNEVSILELAQLMRSTYARIAGDPSYETLSIESVSAADFYGPDYEDCDRRMPRLDKARELLDWRPQADLQEILDEVVGYYFEAYGRSGAAQAR